MRRITLWALSTLTSLVLLFSYHTSTSSTGATSAAPVLANAAAANGSASSGTTGTSTPTPTTSASGSTPSTSATPKATTSTAAAKTYTGDAVGTRYGDVQVQITVRAGKIVTATVVQVPWNDPRDQEINSVAVPQLNAEVVQAQSATIDMVSGATFTSQGYQQSLQSAIDQAHL